MSTTSDPYEDVALIYTEIIRKECEKAGAAIEQIHAECGAHAALRVALIIKILKLDAQQNHLLPEVDLYAHLLEDYPDSIPLAKYAMTCCLQEWAVSIVYPR